MGRIKTSKTCRVGVVTIADYRNFGNRLQNYAGCYTLKKRFGCKVESLEVDKSQPGNRNLVQYIKESLAIRISAFPKISERLGLGKACRNGAFRRWSRMIPTRRFYGCEDLPAFLNVEYDMFFAGSDQIWNHHFRTFRVNDVFLRFAEEQKRAALSASFGVEEIPEDLQEIYREGLNGFTHISVREDAGARIVKELTGRDVPVLVDPVMMLDEAEWMEVAKKPRVDISKPYVLKYYLGDDAEADKINTWAKANGYEVYELMNPEIPDLYSAGPGEFLSLIHGASLVFSDSFHCIAFSILFSRPFVVFARQGKAAFSSQMTSRMDTLLGKFGFEGRWKHLLSEDDYLACDFSQVGERLAAERERFVAYVSGVLNAEADGK